MQVQNVKKIRIKITRKSEKEKEKKRRGFTVDDAP